MPLSDLLAAAASDGCSFHPGVSPANPASVRGALPRSRTPAGPAFARFGPTGATSFGPSRSDPPSVRRGVYLVLGPAGVPSVGCLAPLARSPLGTLFICPVVPQRCHPPGPAELMSHSSAAQLLWHALHLRRPGRSAILSAESGRGKVLPPRPDGRPLLLAGPPSDVAGVAAPLSDPLRLALARSDLVGQKLLR